MFLINTSVSLLKLKVVTLLSSNRPSFVGSSLKIVGKTQLLNAVVLLSYLHPLRCQLNPGICSLTELDNAGLTGTRAGENNLAVEITSSQKDFLGYGRVRVTKEAWQRSGVHSAFSKLQS